MIWEKIRFGDLYDIESRNGLTKPSKVRGSGYKMINMGELFSNDRIYDVPMELVPLKNSEKKAARVQPGDLLFARQSLVLRGAGKCSIVMETSDLTVFESHLIRVRLNTALASPLFYYYFFKSPYSPIGSIVSQCAQAGIRGSELQELEVFFPPLEFQKRIAERLSVYDDLIENNRQQIKLLEEASQRLYEEWFVNLRFPGYETVKIIDGVPGGWERDIIGNVITFNPKVKIDKNREKQCVPMASLSTTSMVLDFSLITWTQSTSGAKFQNGDTLFARITPCLENGKTAFVSGIESSEGAVGSTEFIVMRSKKLNPYMVYALARSSEFRNTAIKSMTGSDGRQRAQIDTIKAMPYLLPPKDLIDEFENINRPIFERIALLNNEIMKISEARDRLIPKLMSGEILV